MKSFCGLLIITRIKTSGKGGRWCLRRPSYGPDWQAPNPHARVFEYHDASVGQRLLDIAKIYEQQTYLLFRTTLRRSAEQDQGWLSRFAQSEESAEVGISGYYNPPFAPGLIENPLVIGRLHLVFANVNGVVSGFAQALGDTWRKGIIDQKSQEAERSGNSRSRTASAA